MSAVETPTPDVAVSPTAPLTAEEFARRYADRRFELVNGVAEELPMPFPKDGLICGTIARLLGNHVADRDIGRVMLNDSFVRTRTKPDAVRGADVCYYSYERLPKGEIPEGLLPVPPDLVVEVRSPSDTWSKVFTKVGEYLDVGVRVVMVLDAVSQSASVYRLEELQRIFHNGDELDVPDVLPGFSAVVRRLFE